MIQHKNFSDIKKKLANKMIPYEAAVEITNDCNLKCNHCNRNIKNDYMSLDNYKILLKQLKNLGTMRIFFTGGEPSIHPDFFDILNITAAKGFSFSVQTNLSNIDNKLIEYFKIEKYWTSIQISLYGYNEETYYKTVNQRGIFKKVKTALDNLKKIHKLLILKTLITNNNYFFLDKLKDFGKKYTNKHLFDFTIFADDIGSKKHKNFRVSFNKYIKYYKDIFDIYNCNLKSNEPTKKIMSENEIINRHICSAGITNICITANGDLMPCVALRINCGNIFKSNLKTVWADSKKLKEIRSYKIKDIQECVKCEILTECKHRCPGLFYAENKNLLKPAKYRCELNKLYYKIIKQQSVKFD